MRKLTIVLMSALLAACAGSGEPRGDGRFEEIAVYERHTTGAESWVRYTSIRNWWPVGFHSVVFEMGGNRHYLVSLIGACDLDLDSAVTLRLVNSRRNVLSEFDEVIVNGRTCQVQSIHRVDYEAVKAELEEKGEDMPAKQGNVSVSGPDQSSGGM
jgi:hypothetical protein